MAPKSDGFVYLGTFDDVVQRYPWRFQVDDRYLRSTLARQAIEGRPVLLNDGYLINHPTLRLQLLDRSSLLWELIDHGFVGIMSRGYGRFGIHEMPERMQHIETFRRLIDGSTGDWPKLRRRLEEVHRYAVDNDRYQRWPAFDTASGYSVFAQRLLRSTPTSLGLRGLINRNNLHGFLGTFIEELSGPGKRGPRDQWEALAKDLANDPDVTNQPKEFVNAMMRLATEIYHYNIGVGLAATYDVPIAVETQASAAFDDLLIDPTIVVEDAAEVPRIPHLKLPAAFADLPGAEIVKVFDADTPLGQARIAWRTALDGLSGGVGNLDDRQRAAKEAGELYGARLREAYAPLMPARLGETMLEVGYGKLTEQAGKFVESAVASAGTFVTGAALGVDHTTAAAMSIAGGVSAGLAQWGLAYVFAYSQSKTLQAAVRRYRIAMHKRSFVPAEAAQRSNQLIERIKRQRVPSSLDLDTTMAHALTAKMKRFEG